MIIKFDWWASRWFLDSCFYPSLRFVSVAITKPSEVRFEPGTYHSTAEIISEQFWWILAAFWGRIEKSKSILLIFEDRECDLYPYSSRNHWGANIKCWCGVRSFCDFKWCFRWVACSQTSGANPDVLRKRSKAPSALDKEDKTYQANVVIVRRRRSWISCSSCSTSW